MRRLGRLGSNRELSLFLSECFYALVQVVVDRVLIRRYRMDYIRFYHLRAYDRINAPQRTFFVSRGAS